MKANDFQRVQNRYRMQNGLPMNSEGRNGGLALMWREEKEGGRKKARSQINEFKDLVDELALGRKPKMQDKDPRLSFNECVTKESNDWLEEDYIESDIVQAIKQMDPRKAPRVDGLSGSFFKYNWEIVAGKLFDFA
ncbi:hypothetical protein GOBAR_DD05706 [Gossypium barbadense]|nr:hypothetical protein GOBAR_DD05706 [Gossypium barbadense]